MADEEHVALLRQGVDAWNAWRKVHPEIEPNLLEVDLRRADLEGVDLSGANLDGARLSVANLSGANLEGAHLSGTHLEGAVLIGAYLSGANLEGANLRGADLRRANLREANLGAAHLIGTHLDRADLEGANLGWADLEGANLRGANFGGAIIYSTTFSDVDLSTVIGLESIVHDGPSTIGIDTLYRSDGKIPLVFLRGCGVPDSFIEYIPALIGAMQPIQYHSCFISYSTADDAFARRLHERMRAEHLRVWFAPEDIKGGEKLYEQIEQAIQLHDRLLLVLSEASIQSPWVTTEIRRARAAERKEQRRKLFPIRLTNFETLRDWTCFDSDSGTDLATEVRSYFIPDFSHWKDHDAFEAAFASLLRDLRAAERPRPPV